MDRVIVTGSSGFIGKHLMPLLYNEGYDVIEMNSKTGDISLENTWNNLPKADIIIHLAGKSFVPDSWLKPEDFIQVNFLGTLQALKYSRLNNSRLIYLSSYMYGNPTYMPIPESAPISVNNPYALSKKLSEDIIQFYASHYDIPCVIFRLFNVYGSGQNNSFLIPAIINAIRKGGQINVRDLKPKRDYVYVKDVVRAILLSLQCDRGFEVYNIGSGRSFSVAELVDIIQGIMGSNLPLLSSEERRKDEIMDTIADISKARTSLGWVPEWGLKEGLQNILSGAD